MMPQRVRRWSCIEGGFAHSCPCTVVLRCCSGTHVDQRPLTLTLRRGCVQTASALPPHSTTTTRSCCKSAGPRRLTTACLQSVGCTRSSRRWSRCTARSGCSDIRVASCGSTIRTPPLHEAHTVSQRTESVGSSDADAVWPLLSRTHALRLRTHPHQRQTTRRRRRPRSARMGCHGRRFT